MLTQASHTRTRVSGPKFRPRDSYLSGQCPLSGIKRIQEDDGTIVLFTGSVPSFRRHEWGT
jgi:hypothetical protein